MVPNLGIFVFSRNFAIRQIWGCWFQKWHFLSNSRVKIPKWGISGPKFKDFHFYTELNNKTNSMTLTFNMAITFSYSSPKTQKLAFVVPKWRIFIFCIKLCYKANSRALIPNITMAFWNCCPKHPNKAFLFQIYEF